MNAILKSLEATDCPQPSLVAEFCTTSARKRGLQRTLQALFREKLLNAEHLISEGAISWLPLWSQQSMLRFEGLHLGRIGNCELAGPVSCYKSGERPRALLTSSALIAFVAGALPCAASPDAIQRLIRELDNSTENDALCLSYRDQWAQELNESIKTSGQSGLITMLMHALPEQHANPALLLEQWGTLGHPWHPGYKTKLGLSAKEVMAMSPEFKPVLAVSLAAIRASKAHIAVAREDCDYRSWFAATFPQSMRAWEQALRQRQKNPEDWLPLPLHPYQVCRLIPEKFAAEIAQGDLLLLAEVALSASPTMSFRTVVPGGSPLLPHLKLPVSLRLTSVQRTVSPKSVVMGPRLTNLLNSILVAEGGFDSTLDIVGEDIGLYYADPDDDRARHLSVLFRSNPMQKRSAMLFPIPAGSLFADSPVDGRALVTELVAQRYGDHGHGALQFYQCYVDTVLTATLSAYLLYGIAFEAHQQNSFIMLNASYEPVKLLARDFGDLRIHGPSLRRAGFTLDAFRPGHSVFETDEPVRDKLLHATMLCHLAELGLLLARSYRCPEAGFWDVLQQSTVKAFERLRDRTDAQRWQTERQAVLESAWPAKAFLKMRLSDTSDDMHGHMPNPLAEPAK
ncbi:MAG: IucA/IucC family protein [Collimonas sp.]